MKQKRWGIWTILAGIIILAAFLRFYGLKSVPPGLFPDEAVNGNNVLEAIETGNYKLFYPENNGREGLFINLQSIPVRIFGNEPWALRSMSGVFGVFTVLAIFFMTREIFWRKKEERSYPFKTTFGEFAGLLASFFVATSFWHINFSRIGFRAIMAPFFLAWSLFFLLRAFFNATEKKSYLWWALAGGVVYGLGWHSYIAYRATPLIILAILIYFLRNYREQARKIWAATGLYALTAFLAFLPLLNYFIKNPADFMGRTSQVSIFTAGNPVINLLWNSIKTIGMLIIYGDANWRHNYHAQPELIIPVALLAFFGFYIIIRSFSKKSEFRKSYGILPSLVLGVTLIVGAAPVVVSSEGIPHALRSVILIPPIFACVGMAAAILYDHARKWSTVARKRVIIISCIILFVLPIQVFYVYFYSWGRSEKTRESFGYSYAETARIVNAANINLPRYVVFKTSDPTAKQLPMGVQTIMFMTGSYTQKQQDSKNIHYILSNQNYKIPYNALVFPVN